MQKGSMLIIVLLIVLILAGIVVLAGGAYYFGKSSSNPQSTTTASTPSPISSASADLKATDEGTPNLTLYVNNTYKYSLQIPKGGTVEKQSEDTKAQLGIDNYICIDESEIVCGIIIRVYPNTRFSIDERLKLYNDIKLKQTINGQEWRFYDGLAEANYAARYYFALHNSYLYEIEGYTDTKAHEDFSNQIIQSFKFTK